MCQDERPKGKTSPCCCQGRMPGLVRPRVLLLLAITPAHGYELLERLSQDAHMTPMDAGMLYRTLRRLEREGLARSEWSAGEGAPARRVYELTDQGLEQLHAWARHMRSMRQHLDSLLADYEARFSAEA